MIVHEGVRPHHCRPPEIYTWDPEQRNEVGIPALTKVLYAGTVFVCDDCGSGWVVEYQPPVTGRAGGLVWRTESRTHRRRRLGLRWWQQEVR